MFFHKASKIKNTRALTVTDYLLTVREFGARIPAQFLVYAKRHDNGELQGSKENIPQNIKARQGLRVEIASLQFPPGSFPMENYRITMLQNDVPSVALLVIQVWSRGTPESP